MTDRENKQGAGSSDEPPYGRYAFLNPYNLSLLAATGVTAAATGHWWIALCGAASEALWMLFAPDSKLLRSAWFDKIWDEDRKRDVEDRRERKFQQLTPADQQRAFLLREQRGRIYKLAADNPSLTVELLAHELTKLDELYEDFLDLALVCARSERHVASFDLPMMKRSWSYYEGQIQKYPDGDDRRSVASKNLDVLNQRRLRYEQMGKNLQTARGQMDLMENSFRLVADEIVTVADPAELGTRLDELRIGVDAIRETSAEADRAFEELDEAEAAQPRTARQ